MPPSKLPDVSTVVRVLLCAAVVCMALVMWPKPNRMGRPMHLPPQANSLSIVINLPRNKARLQRFLTAYNNSDFAGVPIRRLVAVEGSELTWSDYLTDGALKQLTAMQRSGYRLAHPDLTPGAVGCYLSHMQAWRCIADAGVPYGFVFEDDAHMNPTAYRTFRKALRNMPPDWDIILLGYLGNGEQINADVKRMNAFMCLHAYAISASAADRLWKGMLPISQQVDWELSGRIKEEGLDVFGLTPSCVFQHWQGTDIQAPLKAQKQA